MREELRHDIVQRWQHGQSQRQIANDLGLSRSAVARVLRTVSRERAEGSSSRGQVTRTASALDEVSRTLLTEIDLKNPEEIDSEELLSCREATPKRARACTSIPRSTRNRGTC